MTVAINNSQRPESMMDKILKGVTAARNAFDIPVDIIGVMKGIKQNQILNQEIKTAEASQDPENPTSKLAQGTTAEAIDAGTKAFNLTNPEQQKRASQLHSLIVGTPAVGNPGDEDYQPAKPGMSAAQINAAMPESNLFAGLAKGKLSADASASRLAGLVGVKQQSLEETRNMNSAKVGEQYEHDPIIKLSKTNLNSLTRSNSILTNQNKPVTTRDLNLAYNDYINAVAAGGSATEGKIQRELPETWAGQFNDLKAKAGEFDDLRQNPTGKKLIGMLAENIGTVRNDIQGAVADQALNIHQNFIASDNPKVQAINKLKLQTYNPTAYGRLYGAPVEQSDNSSGISIVPGGGGTAAQAGSSPPHPQDSSALNWAKKNPNDPRAAVILKGLGQ